MKKLLLFLPFIFTGCFPTFYNKVYKHPDEYTWDAMIPLDWDGNYPIKTWQTELPLNMTFYGTKGFEYKLIPLDNDIVLLQVNITKNLYE